MLDFITRQANRRPDPTWAWVIPPRRRLTLQPTGSDRSWLLLPVITWTVERNKRRDPINDSVTHVYVKTTVPVGLLCSVCKRALSRVYGTL